MIVVNTIHIFVLLRDGNGERKEKRSGRRPLSSPS
jgi:hypothetical protein